MTWLEIPEQPDEGTRNGVFRALNDAADSIGMNEPAWADLLLVLAAYARSGEDAAVEFQRFLSESQ